MQIGAQQAGKVGHALAGTAGDVDANGPRLTRLAGRGQSREFFCRKRSVGRAVESNIAAAICQKHENRAAATALDGQGQFHSGFQTRR